MDILIRAGGFSNKGGEAMMLTVRQELSQRVPGISFLLRLPPQQARMASQAGFIPITIEKSRLKKGVHLLLRVLSRSEVRKALVFNTLGALELADVKRVDGVLDISGFGYSDSWGPEPAERSLVWIRHCQKKGIPYVHMPQAWGPFTKPQVAKNVMEMCQLSSLIYARDEESFSHLSGLSPEFRDKVKLAPDIAFKFQGAENETGAAVLSDLGLETGRYPLVGLTPNLRVYERMEGKETDSVYVQLLIKIACGLMEKWGAAVVLIPHEIALGQSVRRDDRFLCGLVHDGISSHGRAVHIDEDLPAGTIKSVIQGLDLLVGSRFHSLVFALASRVPAVALGWTHKYGELMRTAGLGDFFLELKNLDKKRALDLVEVAWASRDKNKDILAETIPRIAGEIDAVFDEVAELLR